MRALNALLFLALVACGAGEEVAPGDTSEGPAGTADARPTRILPMNSAVTDFVLSLVPRERVVAVPRAALVYACVLQRGEPWPEDATVPKFSAEAMLAQRPDLVIAHRWQVPAEALDLVESSGVEVLRLDDVRSMRDVHESLRRVASAVGEPRAGAALVAELGQREAALAASADRRAGLTVLSYTNFGSGGWSAGTGTTADLVIGLAGMKNAGAEGGREGAYEIDIERILDLDPDVILVSRSAEEYSASRTYLDDEAALESLRALRRDRVVELPWHEFGTNSHYLVDAAEGLAAEVDAWIAAGR